MKYVITDTCYWLGLVDQTDQRHEKSIKIYNVIKNDLIIFPFSMKLSEINFLKINAD